MKKATAGIVLWFTGLPSSGKSTLAHRLEVLFEQAGVPVQVLDSDELRSWLTPDPDYSEEERDWYYQAIQEIARILSSNGVHVLIAATAPKRAYRDKARALFPHFAEVYVQCPLTVCQKRDPKGLWKKAGEGKIQRLPGAGSPYEVPLDPEITVDTSQKSVDESVQTIIDRLGDLGIPLYSN